MFKATLNGVSPVAVKVLKDQSLASRDVFWREVALLKSLRNSNIVQFQVGRRAPALRAGRWTLRPKLRPRASGGPAGRWTGGVV